MLAVYNFTTASGREPVNIFINKQDDQAQTKIDEVIGYFRIYGFHLETNYLRRMKGSRNLWELRAKFRSKQYRIFLAKLGNNAALLLHAIVKKTAKTPIKDISTARKRLRQLGETVV